ncbi:hypothetical protein HNQ69_001512 [Bartonella callosciuri]|uniref:Uncharacterized protein n=1 Tax=Bartonella callosciuri TaxID=686223 RepID=A0A840NS82_9HYPH|nr:hypothetical protein [Bartonella callosciuri]MBB5074374.1 hypothetical protein [Bartonella callosciuri]
MKLVSNEIGFECFFDSFLSVASSPSLMFYNVHCFIGCRVDSCRVDSCRVDSCRVDVAELMAAELMAAGLIAAGLIAAGLMLQS